ncbi:hypothetical protein [Methylobacterium nodulans]|uniref:hypothetical protein n=1 Tax=Methylobacterium nodulans TaxID=114616 RepID=UPI00016197FF|nr:hypothetical protein [Methylobacterium nodulans]
MRALGPGLGLQVGEVDRDLVLALLRVGEVVAPPAHEGAAPEGVQLPVEALQLGPGDGLLADRRDRGGPGLRDRASGDDADRPECGLAREIRRSGGLVRLGGGDPLLADDDLLLNVREARLPVLVEPGGEIALDRGELADLRFQRAQALAGGGEVSLQWRFRRAGDAVVLDGEQALTGIAVLAALTLTFCARPRRRRPAPAATLREPLQA